MRRTFTLVALLFVLLVAAGAVWIALSLRASAVDPPSLTGELRAGSLEHEGRSRTWKVYIPAVLTEAPALVLVLHASMGDGDGARASTFYEFDRLADRFGFVVAYPDGWERHWNGCRKAGPYAANELNVDDVGFLVALVDRLAGEVGIGPERVFATGISNGGQMSMRLALEAPERVRGVAPVAASMPAEDNLGCTPSGKPVAFLLMNGTEDPMNPYEGGTVALYGVWGNRGTVLSSEQTAAYFAGLAGHRDSPVGDRFPDLAKHDDSWVERRIWRSGPGPEVALYVVHGGGHTFPHPRFRFPSFIGPTNADIDAAAEIWSFFARELAR